MQNKQILAIAVFLLLIVLLLNEIAFQLGNVKILVAIPNEFGTVIEGEAREVPASDA